MYVIKQNKKKEWILIKKGAKRATRIFQTKLEAEMYAKAKCPDDYEIEEDEHPTNTTKKAQKKLEGNEKKSKKKKKSRVIFTILFILLLVVIAGGAFLYFNGYLDNIIAEIGGNKNDLNNGNNGSNSNQNPDSSNNNGNNGSNNNPNPDSGNNDGNNGSSSGSNSGTSGGNSSSSGITEGVKYDDFQIHFMTLGNDKAGDSIYIKAGDTDILIDAGSRSGSSSTTIEYMKEYVKDGKFEYVIMTHGDQDHIEAFPNILKVFSADTIIYNQFTCKTTTAYKNTIAAFASQQSKGANIYYAGDCYNNLNGARRQYQLSSNVTMDILYNKYYYEKGYTSSSAPSGWENNYSVCTLFTYTVNGKSKYFMLTGDLEKEGEEAMASYYDSSTSEKTLPEVDLFKAGHHGSKTSSNDCLLSLIKPKMCVVSCCCGTNEYTGVTDNQFPTQAFISRIAKYTDAVYVTSIYESYTIATKQDGQNVPGVEVGGNYIKTTGFKEMNGNVVVSCNGEIGLFCSNNYIKLKDSEWFNTKITIDGVERQMRTWPEI